MQWLRAIATTLSHDNRKCSLSGAYFPRNAIRANFLEDDTTTFEHEAGIGLE